MITYINCYIPGTEDVVSPATGLVFFGTGLGAFWTGLGPLEGGTGDGLFDGGYFK